MNSAPPDLSIVIPTWNGRALVAECLESLARQTLAGFQTIVVDDGSTDDTAACLREHFREVELVVCGRNRGFASAVNTGIGQARGRWVLLLNNDVTLAEDCLEKLMAAADTGDFAMLAPLVLWKEDPRLVYSAGDAIAASGRPVARGYRCPRESLQLAGEPFGVSGGYGLFKRELLDTVGVLDPAFVAYFEDSDLCFRARWAGYRATVVPGALAWHIGSATIRNRLWWRTRQCYQNHALLVLKNFSWPLLYWNAGPVLRERLHQGARVFRVARTEWGAARAMLHTAGAWFGLMRRVPHALLQRRRIMARRALSSADMQDLLRTGSQHE